MNGAIADNEVRPAHHNPITRRITDFAVDDGHTRASRVEGDGVIADRLADMQKARTADRDVLARSGSPETENAMVIEVMQICVINLDQCAGSPGLRQADASITVMDMQIAQNQVGNLACH